MAKKVKSNSIPAFVVAMDCRQFILALMAAGLTQKQIGIETELYESDLSRIRRTERSGSEQTWRALAAAALAKCTVKQLEEAFHGER